MFTKMLSEGSKIVKGCSCGGNEADTACYSCLCNYYNQRQHDILKRQYAIEFYDNVLNSCDKYIMCEVEVDEIQTEEVEARDIARYNFNGQDQSGMSFEDIWNYILDDIDTDTEENVINQLIEKTSTGVFQKPYYGGSITNLGTGEEIFVDLIWPSLNVSLHLSDNYQEFEKMKETAWKSYCIKDDFPVEEFVEEIKG